MILRFLSLLSILAFSFSNPASLHAEAQKDYLTKFINITIADGLSSNNVLRIFQDSDGIMWFGTMNGLTRFDGYHYTLFRSDITDSTTISDNTVTALVEDLDGNLWIGTGNGLNIMDRETGKVKRLMAGGYDGMFTKKKIYALLSDMDGDIWVLSDGGIISKYSISDGNWQTKNVYSFPIEGDYFYYEMIEDYKSRIWLSGRAIPLSIVSDTPSGLYVDSRSFSILGKIEPEISSIAQTDCNDIWLGSQRHNAITRYGDSRTNDSVDFIIPVSPRTMGCDSSNTLWIGGGNGIVRFDSENYKMTHYIYSPSNPNSLISNTVNHIFIDRDNNVWIGTDKGISIYSEYMNNIRHYRKIGSDSAGLSSNNVTALLEDKDGLFWVGTDDNGVDTINLSTGKYGNMKYSLIGVPLDDKTKKREAFTLYQYRLHGMVEPRNENKVSALYQDSDGNIHIGLWSHVGFNIYDKRKDEFSRYALWGVGLNDFVKIDCYMAQNPWGSNWYSGFLEDSKGRFWTATWEGMGMTQFDLKKRKFVGENDIKPSFFRDNLIVYLQLHYDAVNKRLWFIGTRNMYGFYDIAQNKFHKYAPHLRYDIINRDLLIGTYWKSLDLDYFDYAGTFSPLHNFNDGNGYGFFIKNGNILVRQDMADGSIEEFCKLPYPFRLNKILFSPDRKYIYIFCGKSLYSIDMESRRIKDMSEGSNVFSAYLDRLDHLGFELYPGIYHFENQFYLYGFGKGLSKYSSPSKIVGIPEFEEEIVNDMKMDGKGDLFVASGNGLFVIKTDSSIVKLVSGLDIKKILVEKDCIWLGTQQGLMVSDFDGNIHKRYIYAPDISTSISSGAVRDICRQDDTSLFVSVGTKIQRLNINTGEFFTINNIDDNRLAYRLANCLMENRRGEIWYGTSDNGLSIIDIETRQFRNHTLQTWNPHSLPSVNVTDIFESSDSTMWVGTEKGLCRYRYNGNDFLRLPKFENIRINKIEEDNSGHLWISTLNGLYCYEPVTDSARIFHSYLGFQGEEYGTASFHLKDGRLAFGGDNGFSIFSPEKILSTPKPKPIAFTDFTVHAIVRYSILPKQIHLSHSDNSFSFDFCATEYCFNDHIQYRYRLGGFENTWNYTSAPSVNARYTNISEGHYTFEIEASNPLGEWSGAVTTLEISVRPPFYLNWWFILLCVLFLVGIVLLIIRFREKSLKREKAVLEHTVAEKTSELKKEIDSKNRFFSIISHDLKNPLNALGLTSHELFEQYDEMSDIQRKNMLQILHSSTENTVEMLNSILVWTLSQTQMITPVFVPIDIHQATDSVIGFLSLPAEKKGLKIRNLIPEGTYSLTDENMFITILRNLIGNAVKFSHPDSWITISSHTEGEKITVSVADTGIGMDEATVAKLFKIDVKVKKQGTSGEKGAGLGLIIVNEFIHRLNETISVTSEPEKGCIFAFTLKAYSKDGKYKGGVP